MTQNGCCLYCSVLFFALPTVHSKQSAADQSANAGDAPTITDGSSKQIRSIGRSPTTARRSGEKLIPTIFRVTARNIPKRSIGIANASNGGTKSAASGGLKRTTYLALNLKRSAAEVWMLGPKDSQS